MEEKESGSPVMRCIGFILLLPVSSLALFLMLYVINSLALAMAAMLAALAGLYLLFAKN